MAGDWTLWDYLTLAGSLLLVIGYLLGRLRANLKARGRCQGCTGCSHASPFQPTCTLNLPEANRKNPPAERNRAEQAPAKTTR